MPGAMHNWWEREYALSLRPIKGAGFWKKKPLTKVMEIFNNYCVKICFRGMCSVHCAKNIRITFQYFDIFLHFWSWVWFCFRKLCHQRKITGYLHNIETLKCSAAGRGVPVVIGGDNLLSPVRIGLCNWSDKYWGGGGGGGVVALLAPPCSGTTEMNFINVRFIRTECLKLSFLNNISMYGIFFLNTALITIHNNKNQKWRKMSKYWYVILIHVVSDYKKGWSEMTSGVS